MKQRLLLLSLMLLAITAGFSQTEMPKSQKQEPATKEYPRGFELDDKAISKMYEKGVYSKFKPEKEILSRRTESAKYFDNGDGTITAMLTAGPCHYLEDGLYHTSNNEVLQYNNPLYPGYTFANVNNKNKSLFSQSDILFLLSGFNSNNSIKYSRGGIVVLDYSKAVIGNMPLNNATPEIDYSNPKNNGGEYNNVVYRNLGTGLNYEVEQLTYKVKSQYVFNDSAYFNSIPDGASYLGFKEVFKFSKNVTTKETDFKGGLKGIGFYDGDKLLLNINETWFFDQKPGTPRNNMEVKVTKISDNEYEVLFIVPSAWFTDHNRVYPIVVDPTLTMTPSASTYWTGTTNEDADAVSSDYIKEGFYDCSGCDDEEWAGYAKFYTGGLPNTNCIFTGNLNFFQYGWVNGNGNDQLQFDVGWLNLDPVPSSWTAIRDGINNLPERYSRWNVWGGIGACGGCNGGWDFNEGCCGWDDMLVNYPLFRNRASWSAGQDYFSIGLDNIVGNNDCYWCWNDETNELYFYGWSNTSRPQMYVDYADNANNACASAYATTSGGSYVYDTRCATYDGPSMNCAGATNPMNLWYYYTAPSYGTLTVANCGSSFDTKINVFAGSCTGIQVGCNDDFCGTSSSVSINVCAGETYYISVGGYSATGTGSGTFTVNFTAGTAPGNPAVFGNGVWNVYGYRGGGISLNGSYCGYYTESNLTYNSTNRWASGGSPSDASGWQGCYVPIDNHAVSSKRTGFTCGKYQIDVSYHDDDAQLYVDGSLVWQHLAGCCDIHTNIWTGYLSTSSTVEFRHLEGGGGSGQGITFTNVTPAITNGNMTINGTAGDITVCQGSSFTIAQNGGSFPDATYCYWIGTNNGSGWVNSWDYWNQVNCNTTSVTSPTFNTPGSYVIHTNGFNSTCGWAYAGAGVTRILTVVADPTWATNTFTPTSGSTICVGGSVTFSASVSGGSGGSVSWVRATTPGGAGTTVTSGDVPPSAGTYYYRPVYTPSVSGCNLADGTERTVIVVADPTWATNTFTPTSGSTICVGGAVTFSATVSGGSGGSVSWVRSTTSGGAGTTVTSGDVPPSTGTYYYRPVYTPSVSGCNLADGTERTVIVVADPTWATNTFTPTSGSTICVGGSVTFSASVSGGSGGSVSWVRATTSGGAGTTVTSGDVPPSAGTYYYRPVYTASVGGCNLADGTERTVIVVADPTWATNTFTPTSGSTICVGGSVTFSATVSGGSGGSVSWVRATTSGGAGTTVTSGDVPPSTGTYYYRPVYTPSVGGCDLADGTERTVIVVADPTWATNTVSSSPVCLGSAVTFSATVSGGSGGTVSWVRSTTSGGAGTTVTSGDVPPSTGTYYYRPQYTATVGGCNLADGTETAVVVSPAAANRTVTAASSTVCSGGTTTLTVVSSESGTSYQLYNVTTAANEGSAQAGNGANLVFTTSPIFSATTYRIIGTRSPCSGIAMNSGSTDFAIGTQTGPIQRTVTVVSSTICNNTAGGVQLLNSESGTVYQLYNETDAVNVGATQTGNGTTLTFSTGNLTADKSFKIIASRNPCTAVDMNNGATVDIYVVGNNTWKGSVSTDWFDGNNWCLGGGIPTSTTDVVIPNGATTNFDPIINANGAVCRTISINTSGILTISGTRNLDVYGDWDNSGVFNYNASTVTFKGTSTSNIGGFTDPQEFNNLKVDKGTNNTPVLDMGTNVTVYGALQPTNGTARVSAGDLVLSSATTIASTAGVEVGGGNLVAGSLAFTNNGLFKVSTGNADVASLTNNSGSAYQTTGGVTTIAGSVTNTGSTITASGGSVTVSGNWSNASSTTATYSGSTIAVVGNYSSASSSVVNANSATVSIGGNYTNTSSTLNLGGAIVSVGGNMVNAAGTVNQNGGAITLNTTGSSFNGNAVLDFDGASSMNISAGNIYLERANGGTGNDLVILSGAGTKTITGGTIHFGNGFTPASQVFKVNNSVVDFNNLTIAGNNAPTLRLLANAATRSTGVLTVNGVFDLNQFTFTVKNSATSAVTASGYILSEATNGNSKLAWNIGNNTGSYVFPFGNAAGVTIPFTFNVTTAGVQNGTGNVTVSTYPSADDNTPWVSGVAHMNFVNGPGTGTDATLDRWWVIDANNYTTKPVSTMTFKYADADLSGNGSIIEGVLKAQRWNATGGPLSSGGWDDPYAFGGTNTNNAGNNTVTVTGVSNYSPWVLHDGESGGNSPLPVELVDFKAACDNNVVTLNWTTATETNDDYFTIQRSADLVNFENVAVVDGAGNSNVYINYTAKDHYPLAGTSYYRLMQTDYNGQSEIFSPIAVTCVTGYSDVISVFPNPANDKLNVTMQLSSSDRGRIIIYNHFGQQVESLFVEPKAGYNTYSFDLGTLAQGQYMVSFMMDGKVLPTQKVIISR